MDEIIRKIIESEHIAKAIVKEAQDAYDNLGKEIEKTVADMKKRSIERAKKEIDRISQKENSSVKSQMTALESDFREQMAAMRAADEKYHEEWIRMFFASIVGSEYAEKTDGVS